jgi:GT2 family glycosyltransferase
VITVIVPSYKNPKYLSACLKSITENSIVDSTQVIAVLDGFVEMYDEVMKAHPQVNFLPLENNMGMQYAINIGVMQAETKYIFVINEDNIFPTRWDERLLQSIDKVKDKQFVMTVNQIEPTGPSMFNFPIANFGENLETFEYEKFLEKENQIASDKLTDDGHIFPFVLEKKYFMAVGGFDTFYNTPYACDWDFFLKLELFDFIFPRTHLLHVYHFGAMSTKKTLERFVFQEKEMIGLEQYQWKWGIQPYNKPGVNSKITPNGQFRGFSV